jgi:hypothetical protein
MDKIRPRMPNIKLLGACLGMAALLCAPAANAHADDAVPPAPVAARAAAPTPTARPHHVHSSHVGMVAPPQVESRPQYPVEHVRTHSEKVEKLRKKNQQ